MLSSGRELGLATLKACVLEEDKKSVPGLLEDLTSRGLIIKMKKDRYRIIEQ